MPLKSLESTSDIKVVPDIVARATYLLAFAYLEKTINISVVDSSSCEKDRIHRVR